MKARYVYYRLNKAGKLVVSRHRAMPKHPEIGKGIPGRVLWDVSTTPPMLMHSHWPYEAYKAGAVWYGTFLALNEAKTKCAIFRMNAMDNAESFLHPTRLTEAYPYDAEPHPHVVES